MKDCNMDLHLNTIREDPTLKIRRPAFNSFLWRPLQPPKPRNNGKKNRRNKKQILWNDDDLIQAMGVIKSRYTMIEVCEGFSIPKISIKDHYNGKIKGRKIEPQKTLTLEEAMIVDYMVEMVRLVHPLCINGLKMKVVEICQQKQTSFKDVPRRS